MKRNTRHFEVKFREKNKTRREVEKQEKRIEKNAVVVVVKEKKKKKSQRRENTTVHERRDSCLRHKPNRVVLTQVDPFGGSFVRHIPVVLYGDTGSVRFSSVL